MSLVKVGLYCILNNVVLKRFPVLSDLLKPAFEKSSKNDS